MPLSLAQQHGLVLDPLWSRIRREADEACAADHAFAGLLHGAILAHDSFESALAARLAGRLEDGSVSAPLLGEFLRDALSRDPDLVQSARIDLQSVLDRDAAASRAKEPLLFFKGYHALQVHRIAHHHWTRNRREVARILHARASAVFHVDIHPAVWIGRAVFLDHATGIVIGEKASIGNNVSILQGVTITGSDMEGRHPRIGDDVLIGAGAKILGSVDVGAASRIGAGALVTSDIPSGVTVAGVPARIVGPAGSLRPASDMDHMLYDVGL